jgi:cytochrome c553
MEVRRPRLFVCLVALSIVTGVAVANTRLAETAAVKPPPAAATGPAATPGLGGAQLYRDYACNSCHGEGGRTGLPGNPTLAGQDQGYLVEQLLAFKTKQRVNGMAQTMVGTVATIPDDELIAISVYLASQTCK